MTLCSVIKSVYSPSTRGGVNVSRRENKTRVIASRSTSYPPLSTIERCQVEGALRLLTTPISLQDTLAQMKSSRLSARPHLHSFLPGRPHGPLSRDKARRCL